MPSAITTCFAVSELVGEIEMYLCAPEINHFRRSISSKEPLLDIELLADIYAIQWIESGVDFNDIPWRVAFDVGKSGKLYMKDEFKHAVVWRNEPAGYKWLCVYNTPAIMGKLAELIFSSSKYLRASNRNVLRARCLAWTDAAYHIRHGKAYTLALLNGMARIAYLSEYRGDIMAYYRMHGIASAIWYRYRQQ